MDICTALIGLRAQETRQVDEHLSAITGVTIDRQVAHYPVDTELLRLLRAVDPDVLFISAEIPAEMEMVVEQALQTLPTLQIVLVDSVARPDTLKSAMKLGVRECQSLPFASEDIRGVIGRSMARRTAVPVGNGGTNCVYSFLPARPGVGTSVLAAQAALSLPTSASHLALLIDADLDAGMIQFMLKVENPFSGFFESMERAEDLDEQSGPTLVSDRGQLDVLKTGESGGDYHPELARLQHVIAFARRHYSAILVDLPSAINRLTVELMHPPRSCSW